jgi:hypothetical protein
MKHSRNTVSCMVMTGDKDEYVTWKSSKQLQTDLRALCFQLSRMRTCNFYCNFPAVWEAMKGFVNRDLSKK